MAGHQSLRPKYAKKNCEWWLRVFEFLTVINTSSSFYVKKCINVNLLVSFSPTCSLHMQFTI